MGSTVPLLLLLLVIIGHLSLIFPQACSHFLKYQSLSVWCAVSMSPGRVARLDLHVMKGWWGKTSGYSAGEQQCTPGYQSAVPNRENREKRHRKKPTRPTVTHTLNGYYTAALEKTFLLLVFVLKSGVHFCFCPTPNIFICCSKVKGRLYCTSEMNSLRKRWRSRAIFSRTGSYLHC